MILIPHEIRENVISHGKPNVINHPQVITILMACFVTIKVWLVHGPRSHEVQA